MIEISAEVQIKSTIKPGSVFYFVEETFSSDEPHYFIVLNKDPFNDKNLIMVCSSSQIQKVIQRCKYLHLPESTLVEINKDEYSDFKVDSIINCNNVTQKAIQQLINKLVQGKLEVKWYVSEELLEKLRNAVICSPLVENELKKLLS